MIAWRVLGAFTVWKNRKMIRWKKRRYPLKKIVIISKQGRVNHELITMLTTLFPECDINVAAAGKQGLEPFPAGSFSESDMADETGET